MARRCRVRADTHAPTATTATSRCAHAGASGSATSSARYPLTARATATRGGSGTSPTPTSERHGHDEQPRARARRPTGAPRGPTRAPWRRWLPRRRHQPARVAPHGGHGQRRRTQHDGDARLRDCGRPRAAPRSVSSVTAAQPIVRAATAASVGTSAAAVCARRSATNRVARAALAAHLLGDPRVAVAQQVRGVQGQVGPVRVVGHTGNLPSKRAGEPTPGPHDEPRLSPLRVRRGRAAGTRPTPPSASAPRNATSAEVRKVMPLAFVPESWKCGSRRVVLVGERHRFEAARPRPRRPRRLPRRRGTTPRCAGPLPASATGASPAARSETSTSGPFSASRARTSSVRLEPVGVHVQVSAPRASCARRRTSRG